MGALESNGVWLYDETDERDTFSELLNIGQDATSDALGLVGGRLTSLESGAALSGISSGIVVAATGWSVGSPNNGRKKNGLAFIELLLTRTGAAIAVPGDGNISNLDMCTFTAGWVPAAGMAYPAPSRDGTVSSFSVFSGGIRLQTTTQVTSIPTGAVFGLSAVYPLA